MSTPASFHAHKAKNNNERVITADYTYNEFTDSGYKFTNKGATSAVELQLPSAKPGMQVKAYVGAACPFRLQPASEQYVALPSTGAYGAADKYISADAIGESVHLFCEETGKWSVKTYIGTWTKES